MLDDEVEQTKPQKNGTTLASPREYDSSILERMSIHLVKGTVIKDSSLGLSRGLFSILFTKKDGCHFNYFFKHYFLFV